MSKEKQIEEMAKLTMKCCEIDNQCGSCHWATCNECLSEALYNAGYRKQSVGEWEKRVFIIFDSEKVGYRCSECNTTWDTTTPYCPKCGSQMTGGNNDE